MAPLFSLKSSIWRRNIDTMKALRNRRKFKNFFIRKDVQLRLIFYHLAFLVVVLAVLIAALLSPLYYDMNQSGQLWTQYVSANLLWRLLDRIAAALILILFCAIANLIVFSHRFCGPLVNFGISFKKISQGDLTRRIHLRSHDFLQPEAALANGMLDALGTAFRELKKNQALLDAAAAELRSGESLDHRTIGRLQSVLQQNKACLNYWRIGD
jgi:methyl-accepting chemotaxis protein